MKIEGWNIIKCGDGYHRAVRRIKDHVASVHLGRNIRSDATQFLRRREQLFRIYYSEPTPQTCHNPELCCVAKYRKKLSAPMRWLFEWGLLEHGSILDYGCGRGNDALLISADKYDPAFYPDKPTMQYDIVTCHYALNVANVKQLLTDIKNYVLPGGKIYYSVLTYKEPLVKTYATYRTVKLDLPVVKRLNSVVIYCQEC